MKRIFIFLIWISIVTAAQAQSSGAVLVKKDSTAAMTKDSAAHAHKIGFAVSGYFGAGVASSNAGSPELNRLQYPTVSNARYPDANYSSSGGLNVGFSLDLLLGKKKNMELSIGLNYLYSSGTAEFDGYHVEYEAMDAMGHPFRRLLTATHASESLSFGNVTIPVLFKYSTNPDKKLGAFIQIGPVLSLSATSSGTMKATMDFEAVYHYDAATQSYTYSPTTAPGDWQITRQAVTGELAPNQNVNDYFTQRYARGYYVALDQSQSGKAAKISYKIGGGMMIRAGGVYRASQRVSLLFGASVIILSNGRSAASYTPVSANNDLTTISLSNFLNGTNSLLTMQAGVNVGVQVKLIK